MSQLQTTTLDTPLAYAADATPTPPSVAVQTLALLYDAYRELNHKKLFWLTLGLSGLVVMAFAAVGIGPGGVTFFGYTLLENFNSNNFPPPTFFKMIYATIAVPQWLGWLGAMLALVSTSSIFPDFLSAGSIDLYLSKPISRVRLFFTKYVMGLLFVALQVTVFTLASYVILGVRGGVWSVGIFLTIPIVLLFFSYLWSISALIGVVTRSTIASILLTLLAWMAIFGVTATEQTLDMFRLQKTTTMAGTVRAMELADKQLATLNTATTRDDSAIKNWEFQKAGRQTEVAELRGSISTLTTFHNIAWWAKFPLPKTSETIDLLRRALVRFADMPAPTEEESSSAISVNNGNDRTANRAQHRRERRDLESAAHEIADSRSIPMVLGTSIVFESLILFIACWIFCRRDY